MAAVNAMATGTERAIKTGAIAMPTAVFAALLSMILFATGGSSMTGKIPHLHLIADQAEFVGDLGRAVVLERVRSIKPCIHLPSLFSIGRIGASPCNLIVQAVQLTQHGGPVQRGRFLGVSRGAGVGVDLFRARKSVRRSRVDFACLYPIVHDFERRIDGGEGILNVQHEIAAIVVPHLERLCPHAAHNNKIVRGSGSRQHARDHTERSRHGRDTPAPTTPFQHQQPFLNGEHGHSFPSPTINIPAPGRLSRGTP